MSNVYRLIFTSPYLKQYHSLTRKDLKLREKVAMTLDKLSINPFDRNLRSHKVGTRRYGIKWSSRVTGDLRIIWDFEAENRMVVLLLDIGGHGGKKKVYR